MDFFLQFNHNFGDSFKLYLEVATKNIFTDSCKAVAALVLWEKVSLIPGSAVPSY